MTEQFDVRMATVRIRRQFKDAPVRPEAELVEGKTFKFLAGWEIDHGSLYVGEWAWSPHPSEMLAGNWPLEAPTWIAEGDLDFSVPATEAQPANTDSVSGSPASKVTRPDEQDAPGSSIGLGAEGEQ